MGTACESRIGEDTLEAYSLGGLPEAELAPLEEHLLVCAVCQRRLADTDAFVAAIRQALRQVAAS